MNPQRLPATIFSAYTFEQIRALAGPPQPPIAVERWRPGARDAALVPIHDIADAAFLRSIGISPE